MQRHHLEPPLQSVEDASTSVLMVTSDAALAAETAAHLLALHIDVELAQGGLETVFSLERHRPDAVVLDLPITDLSGARLLYLLRRDPATRYVPVIVLSAVSFQEAWDVVQEHPEVFLHKPVEPEAIVDALLQVLRQQPHHEMAAPQHEVHAPVDRVMSTPTETKTPAAVG